MDRGINSNPNVPGLVPELFDRGAERLPSSGQVSAATLAGSVLFAAELLIAPLTLAITIAVSVLMWWLLEAPWSGRRRRRRGSTSRGLSPRVLYLSTLMLVGLWMAVMFIFRASDPSLSSGLSNTLPAIVGGFDVSMLERLNGMRVSPIQSAPLQPIKSGVAPFSLFAHGVASTIATSLLAYTALAARRRLRGAARADHPRLVRQAAAAGAAGVRRGGPRVHPHVLRGGRGRAPDRLAAAVPGDHLVVERDRRGGRPPGRAAGRPR
ncbi:MAG: hypothetical protein K2X99_10115, partial [Gemmatimonadaceae bacterium]|nr:hypothetical protein [Gemmatimonadaceae bacterium]